MFNFLCYQLQIRRVFGGKRQQAGLWKPPHEKKTFREEAQKQDATASECPDGRETERYLERRGGRWWRGGSVEQLVAWRDPEYKPSERKLFALHHIPLPLRLKRRAQANQMIFHTKTVFHYPLVDPSSSTCCFPRGTRLQGPSRLFYQLKKNVNLISGFSQRASFSSRGMSVLTVQSWNVGKTVENIHTLKPSHLLLLKTWDDSHWKAWSSLLWSLSGTAHSQAVFSFIQL